MSASHVGNVACPAPNAHARLDQCHRLWHQAAEHYGDPANFITNLNALIQALRSVSLLLQKEKAGLTNFDDWYLPWQEKAKQDRLLKWLNDARVQVFHIAELKTRSYVHARILLGGPVAETKFDVPVDMATASIASNLALFGLPPIPKVVREKSILSVERRWLCEEIDDVELLDILAHCYVQIVLLLRTAHEASGKDLNACVLTKPLHGNDVYTESRPECMFPYDARRTVRIDLGDGQELTVYQERRGPITDDERNEAARRYGVGRQPRLSHPPTLEDHVKTHAFTARKLLIKDKHLQRHIFLRTPSKGWEVHVINAASKAEKTVIIELVAQRVAQAKADMLIDVGETWYSDQSEFRPEHLLNSNDQLGRKEAISVSGIDASGGKYFLVIPFRRGIFGGIKLSDAAEMAVEGLDYLEPVYRVWGLDPVARNT